MPTTTPQYYVYSQNKQGPLSRLKPSRLILASVLALALLGTTSFFGYNYYSQHQARTIARTFIANLNSGNITKAYSLTSTNLKNNYSPEGLNLALGDLTTTKPAATNELTATDGYSTAVYQIHQYGAPNLPEGTTHATFSLALTRTNPFNWSVDSIAVRAE